MKVFVYLYFTTLFLTIIKFTSSNLLFNLKPRGSRCFIEELYASNMAMVKYTINSGEDKVDENYASKFMIKAFSEENENEVLIDKVLPNLNGKLSMTAPNDGQYRICIYNNNNSGEKVLTNLTILSDNMDEPNLQDALKKDDLMESHQKLSSIVSKGEKYVRRQEKILKYTNEDYEQIIRVEKIFLYMTFAQIILALSLGVYQILNFKKYLDKNLLDF